MSVSLKQIRAFVTLADCRTYAEAATILHMSQPALSLTIKSLEDNVGGQLLKRTTRSFRLTPEGLNFLPKAKSLLTDWDTSLESLKSHFLLHSGQVSIAVMPSFAATLLPKALKTFKDAHPDIVIALNDVIAEQAVDMVRKGKVDVGISFEPEVLDDLNFEPLFWDEFVALLPPDHALAKRETISIEALLNEPFLSLQAPSVVTRIIKQKVDELGLSYFSDMQAHQLGTIGRMVSEGLGVGIAPSVCSQQMTEMGVICRRLHDVSIGSQIGVLTLKRYALSVASETFIRVVKQVLRNDSAES